MATAVLENNNKFAYLGLRRKPTYDELIGLINENSSLFGPAPDRRATAFKASPEGSFFDGLNYTDRLKEEQERILNKEMRDILFRQNVGNQTISVARLQNNQGQSTPSSNSSSLPQQVSLNEGLLQEQLQQRARQALQRTQQTADEHSAFCLLPCCCAFLLCLCCGQLLGFLLCCVVRWYAVLKCCQKCRGGIAKFDC